MGTLADDFLKLFGYSPFRPDWPEASRFGYTRQTGLSTRDRPITGIDRKQYVRDDAPNAIVSRYMVGINITSSAGIPPAITFSVPAPWPANLRVTLRSLSAWSQSGLFTMQYVIKPKPMFPLGGGTFASRNFAVYRLDDFALISEQPGADHVGAPFMKWNLGDIPVGSAFQGSMFVVTETNATIRGSLHSLLPFESVMNSGQLMRGQEIAFSNGGVNAQQMIVIGEWLEELPNV